MRLERQQEVERTYPASALSPLLNREARDAANRWLARFAPFLDGNDRLGEAGIRERLAELPGLRDEGARALAGLEAQATQDDVTLLTTLRDALGELDSLESDLRRRLALLVPGDPEGQVDLVSLREKLAEAAARREVAAVTGGIALRPAVLELDGARGSGITSLAPALAGIGMLCFITFHAFAMIGGLYRAFGPFAFLLAPFYLPFVLAGLGLLAAGFAAASRERLLLEARELTILRKLGPFSWQRRYTLAADNRAQIRAAPLRTQSPGVQAPLTAVVLLDADGREVRFGSGLSEPQQQRLLEQINEYLQAQ